MQFLLADSSQAAVERLRTELGWLGDCLVVVGVDTPTGREWNVHVHVHDVGAAIEAGIRAGRPHQIAVTALAPVQGPAAVAGVRATLALVPDGPAAEGLAELFGAEGVRVLVVALPHDPDDTAAADAVQDAVRAGRAGLRRRRRRRAARRPRPGRTGDPGRRRRPGRGPRRRRGAHPLTGAGPGRGGRGRPAGAGSPTTSSP